MGACNQAKFLDLVDAKTVKEFLHNAFPTVEETNINIKTIGFTEEAIINACIGRTKNTNTQRYYMHNTSDCDIYTDGEVLCTKNGKGVLDFTRAFFIERNKRGVPTNLTVVFRYDSKRSINEKEVINSMDASLLSLMI